MDEPAWNGRWKRVSIAVGILVGLFTIWNLSGSPVLATQSYHDSDMDRVEGLIACDYFDVPPEECPYAPPRPPGASR